MLLLAIAVENFRDASTVNTYLGCNFTLRHIGVSSEIINTTLHAVSDRPGFSRSTPHDGPAAHQCKGLIYL